MLVIGQETRLVVLNFLSALIGIAIWILAVRPEFAMLSVNQVASLALLLALSSYAVSAGAAWHCSKAFGWQR